MLILGEASSVSQGTGEPDTGGVTAGGPARRGQGSTGSGKTQLQVGHNRHKISSMHRRSPSFSMLHTESWERGPGDEINDAFGCV